ncbi:carboxypeptidase-like regulatory domain-containing protein [Lentisphaerota bacterium ZTH]|nr:carboxypeptidase regulatory-like domain-containing protein [Lentisphaerota bacterium]WET07097.1 carboxypeptidase-like regulatory domain-containing protein [Lentisphaerota bacterium ZTH]
MKKVLCIAVSFLIISIMTSCLPGGISGVAPDINGHVIDATSLAPIENAHIKYSRGKYTKETTSDEDGRFSFGSMIQWHYITYLGSPGLYPFPDRINYDCIAIPALVSVNARGYIPKTVSIYVGGGEIQDGKLKKPKTDYKFDDDIIVKLSKK